jgi:hypothetical protein
MSSLDHPASDTVSTPEGDNEFSSGQPLKPLQDHSLQVPPASKPGTLAEQQDQPAPKGLEKFIDEVASGEYM